MTVKQAEKLEAQAYMAVKKVPVEVAALSVPQYGVKVDGNWVVGGDGIIFHTPYKRVAEAQAEIEEYGSRQTDYPKAVKIEVCLI